MVSMDWFSPRFCWPYLLSSLVINFLVANGVRLLMFLFRLMNPIGMLSLCRIRMMTLFPVELLSPSSMTLARLAILLNMCVRMRLPRLAAVLSRSRYLAMGVPPLTMWWTPLSLLTRPVPPRRCLVALISIMLMFLVMFRAIVLNVMDVGLLFLGLWIAWMLIWLFYAASRLVVVVWKALVVFSSMAPFLVMSSWVSPLIAAAPLALPMLMIRIMVGSLLVLAVPRVWLSAGLVSWISLACSILCVPLVLVMLLTVSLCCRAAISLAAGLMLRLVLTKAVLKLL